MRLTPSTLLIGILFSTGVALAETMPAQASTAHFQGTEQLEATLSPTEARPYQRRRRTAHRGSGRRQMIRHILATEA